MRDGDQTNTQNAASGVMRDVFQITGRGTASLTTDLSGVVRISDTAGPVVDGIKKATRLRFVGTWFAAMGGAG